MNNQTKLPVPAPRPRQPTVMGMGGSMDAERPDPRIAELEQQNAQLEAQNGMLEAALRLANAAHKAAEQEVDVARAIHQTDIAKIGELNEMLTATAKMSGDEMAVYFRSRLPVKDARIDELTRAVASKFDLFNVFLSEQERMLRNGLLWVRIFAEEFAVDLNDPELQLRLIARIKEIHSDLDEAQIGMALSQHPRTTRPVRDSEVEIDPLPKNASKASRSPRPDEVMPATQPSRALAAHPITMPPLAPIASTSPSADDGEVELDVDNPDNPGRATWDMGELPPTR